MKNLLLALLFLVSLVGMSSCSEDFEVAAPYKDVTVVYGMFDIADTAHYIRIQKVFMDQTKSAFVTSQIPDSSYFKDLNVHIKTISGTNVIADTKLDRVDMDLEGLPKDQGTFFTKPHFAYKFKSTLSPAYTYRLVITNVATGAVDSAETRVINNNGTPSDGGFYVAELVPGTNFTLDLHRSAVSKITFNVKMPNNAGRDNSNPGYLEGYIRFKYVSEKNGVMTDSSFVWNFASTTGIPGDNIKLETTVSSFMSTVATTLGPVGTDTKRYLDSADVFVWAANEDYYRYRQANQAQLGITADQIQPNYTNIRGKDVLGLFSNRAQRIRINIPYSKASIDSFIRSRVTAPLNFVGLATH